MRTDSELTMCLCNWAREEWTHAIIDELCKQSVRPIIMVWNNNPDIIFKNDKADLIINSSQNMHVRHVPALWQMSATPFVGRMDDDLHFADDEVLADALEVSRSRRSCSQLVGAYGVRVFNNSSYADGHHISVPKGHGQYKIKGGPVKEAPDNLSVDLVKGRILLANLMGVAELKATCSHFHVDLYISTAMAKRRRLWHTLAGCFYDQKKEQSRLVDFPVDGKGYCDIEGHTEVRNSITNNWIAQCAPDKRVKHKPTPLNPPAPES